MKSVINSDVQLPKDRRQEELMVLSGEGKENMGCMLEVKRQVII
jgi:hypothetical protein